MCGRYAAFRSAQDLADDFAIAEIAQDARLLPPSWNVAPTDPVRIVVERAAEGEVRRSLQCARWGLVPGWAKGPQQGARHINAKAETLLDKPMFRNPLGARRALVPADGYYEWRHLSDGPRPAKQPIYLRTPAGFAFAGLYEFWRDESKAQDDPDRWLVTTTIITTTPMADIAYIHDRMPLILPPTAWDRWLDPAVDAHGVRDLLVTPSLHVETVAVSTAVNSVANNGPNLLLPYPSATADGGH